MIRVARIKDGLVINIEMIASGDVATYNGPDLLVPYTDSNPASIGYGWSEAGGFEQPVDPWAV